MAARKLDEEKFSLHGSIAAGSSCPVPARSDERLPRSDDAHKMAGASEGCRIYAGYWHRNQIEHLLADGFQVLASPASMVRDGARPGWEGGMYSFMRRVHSTDLGRELYIKPGHNIEPVFGQIKHNRGMTRFRRRGRAAVRVPVAGDRSYHNLLKLHNHGSRPRPGEPARRVRGSAEPRLTVTPLPDSLVARAATTLTGA